MAARTMEVELRNLHNGTRITCAKVGLYREARVFRIARKSAVRVEVTTTAGRFSLPAGAMVTVHCGPRTSR